MGSTERKESLNLLELRPLRKKEWHAEGNIVIVSMPRFKSRAGRKFARMMGREEEYRLKLDEISSFVWARCDGEKSVAELAEELRDRFGDAVEPLYERLGKMLEILERNGIIELR
jgi:hypothetical protein